MTDVGISAITVAELQYGVQKSTKPIPEPASARLIPAATNDSSHSMMVQRSSMVRYEAYLKSQGLPIGSLDTLIAAQAAQHNLTLVTNYVREFSTRLQSDC